mmetsp:Transcript_4549/g.6560  ORF Transcript_4549/g.6560 Transcript_4549/m.6560 type:complete len:233 (-) Transcript_4549:586-1284(-)
MIFADNSWAVSSTLVAVCFSSSYTSPSSSSPTEDSSFSGSSLNKGPLSSSLSITCCCDSLRLASMANAMPICSSSSMSSLDKDEGCANFARGFVILLTFFNIFFFFRIFGFLTFGSGESIHASEENDFFASDLFILSVISKSSSLSLSLSIMTFFFFVWTAKLEARLFPLMPSLFRFVFLSCVSFLDAASTFPSPSSSDVISVFGWFSVLVLTGGVASAEESSSEKFINFFC